jgi:subtilisin family serine protease
MMKKWLCLFLLFGFLTLGACNQVSNTPSPAPVSTVAPVALSRLLALPDIFPKIDRRPDPVNWDRGEIRTRPTYNPDSDEMWQMDLRSYDLSNLNFSKSLNDLMYADFDSKTIWPATDRMPQNFDWRQIMELGKNPGLGIRKLHAQGITGRSVGIAIIDQPLIVDHQEYTSQMRLYEEINISPNTESQMHGPAVASIAVGKTVGVAPDADLYYIGSWTGDWGTGGPDNFTYNFRYYAQAVRRILEINKQLPDGRKIRVIAMQTGWSSDQAGYKEITDAVNEAKAAGLLVVSSSLEETFGFKFQALGRAPLADPDKFESYEPGLFWAKEYYLGEQFSGRLPVPTDSLLVPMDSRTTAGPGGRDEYVFYREGGWSWSIPYIAGTYALAAQVKPTITPNEFWQLALQTGKTIEINHAGKIFRLGRILDPTALMIALQK